MLFLHRFFFVDNLVAKEEREDISTIQYCSYELCNKSWKKNKWKWKAHTQILQWQNILSWPYLPTLSWYQGVMSWQMGNCVTMTCFSGKGNGKECMHLNYLLFLWSVSKPINWIGPRLIQSISFNVCVSFFLFVPYHLFLTEWNEDFRRRRCSIIKLLKKEINFFILTLSITKTYHSRIT